MGRPQEFGLSRTYQGRTEGALMGSASLWERRPGSQGPLCWKLSGLDGGWVRTQTSEVGVQLPQFTGLVR